MNHKHNHSHNCSVDHAAIEAKFSKIVEIIQGELGEGAPALVFTEHGAICLGTPVDMIELAKYSEKYVKRMVKEIVEKAVSDDDHGRHHGN